MPTKCVKSRLGFENHGMIGLETETSDEIGFTLTETQEDQHHSRENIADLSGSVLQIGVWAILTLTIHAFSAGNKN